MIPYNAAAPSKSFPKNSIFSFESPDSLYILSRVFCDNGFGYDFMFIPDGFDKTIGQIDESIKLQISHRSKGLELAKPILKMLSRYY